MEHSQQVIRARGDAGAPCPARVGSSAGRRSSGWIPLGQFKLLLKHTCTAEDQRTQDPCAPQSRLQTQSPASAWSHELDSQSEMTHSCVYVRARAHMPVRVCVAWKLTITNSTYFSDYFCQAAANVAERKQKTSALIRKFPNVVFAFNKSK